MNLLKRQHHGTKNPTLTNTAQPTYSNIIMKLALTEFKLINTIIVSLEFILHVKDFPIVKSSTLQHITTHTLIKTINYKATTDYTQTQKSHIHTQTGHYKPAYHSIMQRIGFVIHSTNYSITLPKREKVANPTCNCHQPKIPQSFLTTNILRNNKEQRPLP